MDSLRDETWKNLQQSMDVHERAHATLIGKFFAALDEALKQSPAKCDNEAFYRQGVEDGKRVRDYNMGYLYLSRAREPLLARWERLEEIEWAKRYWDRAFRGARGIARVEIRQRLERLKGTDNG